MLIQTRKQFEHIKTILMDAPKFAADTETFYIEPGVEPKLFGIAIHAPIYGKDAEISAYLPFRHEILPMFEGKVLNLPEEWLDELRPTFERPDATQIYHNAKFDLRVFEQEGWKITAPILDTMILHYMIDENPPHSLEALSKKYFEEDQKDAGEIGKVAEALGKMFPQEVEKWQKKLGETAPKAAKRVGWPKVPADAMEVYASRDARKTYQLEPILMKAVKADDQLHLVENKMQMVRIIKGMEQVGIGVKRDRLKELAYNGRARQEEIQAELEFDPGKPSQLARKLFGPVPQGLQLPLPKSIRKDNLPVMDEESLSRYDHPVVDLVLEYRGVQHAVSTYFEGFLKAIWPDDRVRTDYRQHGTVTGRFASGNTKEWKPNLQQLPKVDEVQREAVKSFLRSEEGFELWEFDYSQAEFRLGACYSYEEDPSIVEAYKSGVDFHALTGERLGIPRGREGGAINGKDFNFMMFYGAGPLKVSQKMGVPMAEARTLRSEWWDQYPGLKLVQAHAEKAALQRGYVRYWNGRRRHFRYPSEAYKAMNSIMQGGVAEIVEKSMIDVQKIKGPKLVAQVHDALWFEIPTAAVDELVPQIQSAMSDWLNDLFPIEFPVDGNRLATAA